MPPKARAPKNPDYIDWATSKAKKIICDDLHKGKLPMTEEEVSTGEAFAFYKQDPAFERVCMKQFKIQLKAHRQQVGREKMRASFPTSTNTNATATMPPKARATKNSDYIDWATSEAKMIICDDLREGKLPMTEEEMSTEAAFAFYKQNPAFELVCMKQFKIQLKAHRQQMGKEKVRAALEEIAWKKDRELHPVKHMNPRGEPEFYLSEAHKLLREDVANNRHKLMTPSVLQQSRPEYQDFALHTFSKRIEQEERYVRYITWLNQDREAQQVKQYVAKAKAKANREKLLGKLQEEKEARENAVKAAIENEKQKMMNAVNENNKRQRK